MMKGQILKGFRDLPPRQALLKEQLIATVRQVFQSFAFFPLETPTLEYAEILTGKYGTNNEHLLYTFFDHGHRHVGLRYDLTVPVSRYLASHPEVIFPFRRYQIQNVFRAEKPQRGRFREFTQCDLDTFGTASPLADAEILLALATTLKKLHFYDFTIRLNSRPLLFFTLTRLGIKEEKQQATFLQSIDKLDKLPLAKVKEELGKKGFPQKIIAQAFRAFDNLEPDKNLQAIIKILNQDALTRSRWQFWPQLARGLDYYTGMIFEIFLNHPNSPGAIAGGGRYDNLIAQLGGRSIKAVGGSLGLDRLLSLLLTEKKGKQPLATIFLTIFQPDLLSATLRLAGQLRAKHFSVEIYPDPEVKLSKQLKYADRRGVKIALILGPDEEKMGQVKVKNLRTHKESLIPQKQLSSFLRKQ